MSRPAKVSTGTTIAAALELDDANAVEWSDSADVVVVGWGAAGACAAIEARATGASVLVIDRFDGGGASTLSGGVVYAGGGAPYPKQARFYATPEAVAMARWPPSSSAIAVSKAKVVGVPTRP